MRYFLYALLTTLLLNAPYTLAGQWGSQDPHLKEISQDKLRAHVAALADTTTQGRACGSAGALIAGNYIKNCFKSYGLLPYNGYSFFQSFRAGASTGHNVIGVIRGRGYSDYLIISAHYDHLGTINGSIYPGADDNASGVALMLQLAEIFAKRARAGDYPIRTIIFVAYDGKESNLAGSAYFARTLRIPPNRIIANLNIDQIGCVLEPPNRNPNYALVVGAERVSPDLKLVIEMANRYNRLGLDLDYTFYGSPAFADFFFQAGDQIHLAKQGVPSILYTSGIHAYTYKPTDLPALLDYDVLAKRTQLLYLVADDLASRKSWLRSK